MNIPLKELKVMTMKDYDNTVQVIDDKGQERHHLMQIGSDITRVRERNDLIRLFSKRIKGFYYFRHAIVTVIDPEGNTYSPFFLDPESSPLVRHKDYDLLVGSHFSLDEPFIRKVFDSQVPLTFYMEDIMDLPGSPSFLRANYEVGIREIMMTPLKRNSKTIGFLNLYSDRQNSFSTEFISLIQGIAPQLSNSLTNILINEKNLRKEEINSALLNLGHEMVKIKDRNDLLNLLNTVLKRFIYFNHSILTLSDEAGENYQVFLADAHLSASLDSAGRQYLHQTVRMSNDIYDVAGNSYLPVVFNLDSTTLKIAPIWHSLAGIDQSKEILLKVLPNGDVRKFGLALFSDRKGVFNEEAIEIIEIISAQLSSMVNHLISNQAIAKREKEKSMLLDFSSAIAAVRTKGNLETAIFDCLENLNHTKLTLLSVISENAEVMEPYIYDKNAAFAVMPVYRELLSTTIPLNEEFSRQVLLSEDPVVFNLTDEMFRQHSSKLTRFWSKAGFKQICGCSLRAGKVEMGILWLLTDESNMELLKGICAQISIAIFNIKTSERLLDYRKQLEIENEHLHEQITTLFNYADIVGDSEQMKAVYEKMEMVAPSSSTVIITGESGTGKELIARAIHDLSPRSHKNLIKVSCAAIPVNLIESELFGHERGAFTAASEPRAGKFELANEGTIFLDEIGELPLEIQVKLLRVIQEKEFERLGGSETIKVDVRIIAATNRDLQAEVTAGKFRSDLYYRLHVFPIALPPLRERKEDIPGLAGHFVQKFSKVSGLRVNGITPGAMKCLLNYEWPGNIRELEHVIERSILLNPGSELKLIQLPRCTEVEGIDLEGGNVKSLEEMEKLHITGVLKTCKGKISGAEGAARKLEIPASTLHSKIKKLNILKTDYSSEVKK